MGSKRDKAKPYFKLTLWISVGDRYSADTVQLRQVILRLGIGEDQLRRRLGAAYPDLQRALDGQVLDKWTASHIDWAISTPLDRP